jgi:hypothetical protein
MSKHWHNKPKAATPLQTEIRYAVVDVVHGEVFTANHRNIGEAFNSRDEDYVPTTGLIVVATRNDIILGEVNRKGILKNRGIPNLKTIWDGPRNIWFVPPPKENPQ